MRLSYQLRFILINCERYLALKLKLIPNYSRKNVKNLNKTKRLIIFCLSCEKTVVFRRKLWSKPLLIKYAVINFTSRPVVISRLYYEVDFEKCLYKARIIVCIDLRYSFINVILNTPTHFLSITEAQVRTIFVKSSKINFLEVIPNEDYNSLHFLMCKCVSWESVSSMFVWTLRFY